MSQKLIAAPNSNRQAFLRLVSKITDKIGTEYLAIILVSLANLLFPLGFLYVSQHGFSPFQTLFARGVVIFFSHIAIGHYLNIPLSFKTAYDFKYLLLRNSIFLIQQSIYTAMHYVLSFPLISSISITGPLFLFITDYYINGVTINKVQAVGIIVSFIGILININGDFIMTLIDPTFQISSNYEHYVVTDIRIKIICALILVFAFFMWSYGIILQKKISYIPSLQISFFLGLQFAFASCIGSNLGFVEPVTLSQFFGACLFSGLVLTSCQLLFISGLNLSKNSGKLGILNLLTAVTAYLISYFRFDEEINLIGFFGLIIMSYGLYKTIFGADK